ncbi:hypothetical protein HMPREF9103_02042 [Lentilactobacillus parafarraginis F0439]|uniref:Uncharacterized protein n=1 Tax=Lentilactobacillus parafarraginis F0439 TaxID=797515 RepID=G9ZQN5_9LACO|nr:hypothetical protein [Lentilactobacillus parafarraginis]EHL97211.1 hypothetical protein HMPREF9103_02042 [Lentilactobacillus parafarraginis F0439]
MTSHNVAINNHLKLRSNYRGWFPSKYKDLISHYILLLFAIFEITMIIQAGKLLSINMLIGAIGLVLILIDGFIRYLQIKRGDYREDKQL